MKKKPRLLYPKTCYFSLSLLRRSLSDPLAERGFNRILPVAFDLEAHWLRTALCLRLDGLGFLFAQRRLLKRSGCRPVHHPLALCGLDRQHGALSVIQFTPIPEKIELPKIAVEIFLADVVVDADDAALDESKTAFDRVGIDRPTRIFFAAVSDCQMAAREVLSNALIPTMLIGHDVGAGVYHVTDRGFQRFARYVRNDVTPNASTTFDRSEYRNLGRCSPTLRPCQQQRYLSMERRERRSNNYR